MRNIHCYNEAFNYLKGKYGVRFLRLTESAETRLRKIYTKAQRVEFEKSLTDKDRIFILNPVEGEADELVLKADELVLKLMDQYFCLSLKPREELYELLDAMGVIKK